MRMPGLQDHSLDVKQACRKDRAIFINTVALSLTWSAMPSLIRRNTSLLIRQRLIRAGACAASPSQSQDVYHVATYPGFDHRVSH